MRRLVVLLSLASACKSTPESVGETPTEIPGLPLPPPVVVPTECIQHEFRGETYDCSTVDRCDLSAASATARIACCDCDASLCEPDPACADPDAPFRLDHLSSQRPDASCMACHNGADPNEPAYTGPDLHDPHPFGAASALPCTVCHGGDGTTHDPDRAHIPPPPELASTTNGFAVWYRRTLAGVDLLPDYTVGGETFTALDWLRFRNPGDIRVTRQAQGCGLTGCHFDHSTWVEQSPMATNAGIFGAALFASGTPNSHGDTDFGHTAADFGVRDVTDLTYGPDPQEIGRVAALEAMPQLAARGIQGGDYIWQNPDYRADLLLGDLHDGTGLEASRVRGDSALETLIRESLALGCGDCHLGSAGRNDGPGRYRSSGCSACHMGVGQDGQLERHQIRSAARAEGSEHITLGMGDDACVTCHQGSNETVLQYWGLRSDPNRDLEEGAQYPRSPVSHTLATSWEYEGQRLFDPQWTSPIFGGRTPEQLIAFEDYDGDGRDDTPMDVHFEAGLTCIDCHGSFDVHGGTADAPTLGIRSRQHQATSVQCESCHGGIESYPSTVGCVGFAGQSAECATDRHGTPLRNVQRDPDGFFWLTSRIDQKRHFVPLVRDIVDAASDRRHPQTNAPLYSPVASYAMGRIDGDSTNGIGPMQLGDAHTGFSHEDDLECVACHSAWTRNDFGTQGRLQYQADSASFNLSSFSGGRVALHNTIYSTYVSPVWFTLGVGPSGKITPLSTATTTFFRYEGLENGDSGTFAFTDRNGNGNNPMAGGRGALGASMHERRVSHSIRGRVDTDSEGPRYCNACHLNTDMDLRPLDELILDYDAGNYAELPYAALHAAIGGGTNNATNSPLWVHMAAGRGTGLLVFDANGCPLNPIDHKQGRARGCFETPASLFESGVPRFDFDRLVEPSGVANSSNGQAMESGTASPLRAGALHPEMAGPLGTHVLRRLSDPDGGLILDSYIDSDGVLRGNAEQFIVP